MTKLSKGKIKTKHNTCWTQKGLKTNTEQHTHCRSSQNTHPHTNPFNSNVQSWEMLVKAQTRHHVVMNGITQGKRREKWTWDEDQAFSQKLYGIYTQWQSQKMLNRRQNDTISYWPSSTLTRPGLTYWSRRKVDERVRKRVREGDDEDTNQRVCTLRLPRREESRSCPVQCKALRVTYCSWWCQDTLQTQTHTH